MVTACFCRSSSRTLILPDAQRSQEKLKPSFKLDCSDPKSEHDVRSLRKPEIGRMLRPSCIVYLQEKQEISYRKQIARQLRTQYAEGICDNHVTYKI